MTAPAPDAPKPPLRDRLRDPLAVALVWLAFGPILAGMTLLAVELFLYTLTGFDLFDALGWTGP